MTKSFPGGKLCKICGGYCKFFDTETKNDIIYTIIQCLKCDTVQTLEHYAPISPDYVNLSVEKLGASHIWMNREHKHNAYNQFMKNLKKLKIINSNLKIIDIGCGTAGFGEYCFQKSIQYSGFDASHAQVEFAIKAGIDVTCATSIRDYLMTCDIDTKAEVVFTLWDVLEHIRNPINLLEELKAVPVKTKYLFISVPNGGALRWKRAIHNIVKGRFSYDAWEHVFYFTPKSLSMAMDNIGFKTLKIGSVVCYPRSLNLAELIRRFSFVLFRYDAAKAPQIYLFAKVL